VSATRRRSNVAARDAGGVHTPMPSPDAQAGGDRAFWRGVLIAGGFSAIPRWTEQPSAGVAECEATLPLSVVAGLRGLVDAWSVPLSTFFLAAHAKVLSALCGEPEIVTGYVPDTGDEALPYRLSTEAVTWQGLTRDARRVETELLAHRGFPVGQLRGDLGLAGPSFETVFDPTGDGEVLDPHTVLGVGVVERDGGLVLRVRYRRDVLDGEAAARIAAYHVAALQLLWAHPQAEHRRQSLLSVGEVRQQLEGLAGPGHKRPDLRAHELFERRAAVDPDVVAAVQNGRSLTYGVLNARANRLARALIAHGLRREGVVAVVVERNLDWLAAVLAVFKAGGVYLPVEPHFPVDRIATTLARAGCVLALTEPASSGNLDVATQSLPGVERLFVEAAYREEHAEDNLGVTVAADQLAYIYFTSGSTGEPKGAMCEHAGMLNHLFAKIDDLGIGEAGVVAQVAPQCFDISLWQLISALLVGGRTVIIGQEAVLDVARFVDALVESEVGVVQVVPSYLEVVLTYLEQHPRELPDLRYVSVTGETLKAELAQRWFAAAPAIKLVNAYGLTETSDDTNHEVMVRAPLGERVPLGRPIPNATVYVVDKALRPVPLGAPGEIVFSGVCVGRGYINDPERTRSAFLTDPYRPGQRLYRSGDHGRWRADGKLEFLGRRDSQVKIRGFRIEIGEIENALLRMPGVRDGAVVVDQAGENKWLLAFLTGPEPLDSELLAKHLGESLPEYMVPAAFHWREALPLTPNGKIDKKALGQLAGELRATTTTSIGGAGPDAPQTPAELRMAAAWAKVLGLPAAAIGRRDHFFDRGGDSLAAVKLSIALDRKVSLKDISAHSVLEALARVLDGQSSGRSGLLQPLSAPAEGTTGTLICFPDAGGNAINFRPLESALRGAGLAVYAVELPGHDLDSAGGGLEPRREPFAPIAELADLVATEIHRRSLTGVQLWGQSAGAALALATAIALARRGVHIERVFVGSQLIGDPSSRRAAVADLLASDNAAILDRLGREGGSADLAALDANRAEQLAEAYRHDGVAACRYFLVALQRPRATRVSAPVSVVVAADDPATAGFASRYREWLVLAEQVELYTLSDGGHHFPRTRPAETAKAVLRAAAHLAAPSGAN
jgi:amino acid adenylation domain-containing protein